MKKVLVFCLMTLLSSVYISVWGDVVTSLNTTTKTLTFTYSGSGSTAITDYDDFDGSGSKKRPATWTFNAETVIIGEGVTTIGTNVFHGCTSLKYVHIPTSVTLIKAGAFKGCTVLARIYYAGTPTDWASKIDFTLTSTYCYAHPFNASNASTRAFYFYGKDTETTDIIFTAGLTDIKPYAFYKANNIGNVHIPGTVTSIGNHALDCSLTRVYINKSVAPTTGTSSITWKSGTDTYLYLRSDATDSYNTTPWYYPTSKNATGAYWLGYSSDHSSIKTACSWKSARYVSKVSGSMDNINWTLNENGVLTLTGYGTISKTYNTTYSSEDVIPWFRFRYLVNKVVINADGGNITDLSNALNLCRWSIEEIKIQQTTIPSGTYTITDEYRNSSDVVTLYVNPDLLLTAKSNAPWNNDRIKLALNDKIVINEATDNTALLTALHDEVVEPFDVQFTRSLTNASYNTFCSPVPLTAAQLGGADIRALESTTYDDGSEELYLNFSSTPLSAVEAGVPYLIKPSSTISNPTFTDVDPGSVVVDPETVETSEVNFHGVLKPTTLTGGDKSILFLGAGNELFWPATTGDIKGLRAYFEIKEGSGARRAVRARMNMDGHSTPTNLESVQPSAISSQKVLRDGKLYIMHNGQMYDVQGRVIDD